jgi:outer membrane protein OmpA-like peptidoglycan-associated protein
MVKKFHMTKLWLLALAFIATTNVFGQKDENITPDPTEDEVVRKRDTDQHGKWKKNDYSFPGKPRNMWQVGVHGGYYFIRGDVASQFGYGFGASVRKALGYSLSLRLNYQYGNAKGMNYNANTIVSGNVDAGRNQTLFDLGYGNGGNNNQFFYNYNMVNHEATVDVLFNLNNLLFHKRRNKVSLYLGGGFGAQTYKTKMDALDANNTIYDFSGIPRPVNPSFADRRDVTDALKNLLDGTYETDAERDVAFEMKLGSYSLNPIFNAIGGVEFRLSKRVTLGLEQKFQFSFRDDLYDGNRWTERGEFTPEDDIPMYTHVRLNFNIGSKTKSVEPLWFVNPLDAQYKNIADINEKMDQLEGLLKDDDNDGVPNRLDKEPNTPADCPVNTRGEQLDSDSDGIPDCQDKEPYSPPGYPIDQNGVAQVPDPVKRALDAADKRYAPIDDERFGKGGNGNGLSEWFLPMIFFDLDRYGIKAESYENLNHVANVMRTYPEMKVVVTGNTDIRNSENYNEALSWNRANEAINYLMTNYGIARERFILQYGGEVKNLVPNASIEQQHAQNRRVEFRVAKEGDKEMAKPSGKAGRK